MGGLSFFDPVDSQKFAITLPTTQIPKLIPNELNKNCYISASIKINMLLSTLVFLLPALPLTTASPFHTHPHRHHTYHTLQTRGYSSFITCPKGSTALQTYINTYLLACCDNKSGVLMNTLDSTGDRQCQSTSSSFADSLSLLFHVGNGKGGPVKTGQKCKGNASVCTGYPNACCAGKKN